MRTETFKYVVENKLYTTRPLARVAAHGCSACTGANGYTLEEWNNMEEW